MGLLALVNGVVTSFGGTTTEIATSDDEVKELLKSIVVEMRLQTILLRSMAPSDDSIDDLRDEIAGDMA